MNKLIVFLTLIILCSVCFATPVQWRVEDGGNGHLYEIVVPIEAILWGDAKLAAEQSGGYLATITSEAEGNFIFSLADPIAAAWDSSGINTLGPWLGGYQQEPDGDWFWVTGEPFVYNNFDDRQPNGNGDWLNLYGLHDNHDLRWNDFDSPVPSYVIEYVPEPCSLVLLSLGGLILRRRRG